MKEEKRLISSEVLFSAIEELLAENRQAVFTVTGMSMWPFLCHGRDQVVIEKCDFKDLKKYDVILLQTPLDVYLLHRITRLTESGFITTGDGNIRRDGWFPESCLRARVVKMIRKGKIIDCQSLTWKMIFRVWVLLFPIRRYLLAMLRRISHFKRR